MFDVIIQIAACHVVQGFRNRIGIKVKSKNISLLGSTGSVGRQTLEVAESIGLRVCAMSAGSGTALLERKPESISPPSFCF
jgi:lactate dehydrogenase-like 2-hydroxyacid dehydrogenase